METVLSAWSQWFRQVHNLIVLNTMNRFEKRSPWPVSKANTRTRAKNVSNRKMCLAGLEARDVSLIAICDVLKGLEAGEWLLC